MGKREVFAGCIVSVLYTFACAYALVTLRGGWIDGAAYFSGVLFVISLLSWLVVPDRFVRYDGGYLVRGLRYLLLSIQVVLLALMGSFVAAILRLAAESNTELRLLCAYRELRRQIELP